MSDRFPRVIGLDELLALEKPLRERPSPLIYFSDRQFARLLTGAIELKRAPRSATGLSKFDGWPGGGMVQSECTNPEGQVCTGQHIPGGRLHPGGVFFDCHCKAGGGVTPAPRCRLLLDKDGFRCVGECEARGSSCRLAYWRDPATRTVTLDCRCRLPQLET
jgi:hypothetical protein